jgi:hypothetical protein
MGTTRDQRLQDTLGWPGATLDDRCSFYGRETSQGTTHLAARWFTVRAPNGRMCLEQRWAVVDQCLHALPGDAA